MKCASTCRAFGRFGWMLAGIEPLHRWHVLRTFIGEANRGETGLGNSSAPR